MTWPNAAFANPEALNVKDPQSSFALREVRQQLTDPRVLPVLAAIGFVLGIIGPFETAERLWIGPRLLYWCSMVFATYGASLFVYALLRPRFDRARAPLWTRIAVQGLINGLAILPIVIAFNAVALSRLPQSVGELTEFAIDCIGVSLSITTAAVLRGRAVADEVPPRPPALLDRLAYDRRGRLLSLSSEDHYVRVRTDRGEELVLMRLADAIREAEPTEGLQVHRSHWVALAAIERATRSGERAVLTLTGGSEIPVSRTYVPALRARGIL